MSNRIDLTGKKFNKLTVLKYVETRKKITYWLCQCECGNQKIINGTHLRGGKIDSCGCTRVENTRQLGYKRRTHGMTNSKTFTSWRSMKERCYYKKHKSYKEYGGAGITVCNRWLNSFENFLEDMGERPEGTTLDRINGAENYTPENCRWATHKEQQRNLKSNKIINFKNQQKCLKEWCEDLKLNYDAVLNRIDKLKWDIEKALTVPIYSGEKVVLASSTLSRTCSPSGQVQNKKELKMTKAELTQKIERLHDKAEKTFGPEFTVLVRQIVNLENLRNAMA